MGLPYAYDSVEHQKKVFTSGALDDIFASTEANNFSVMAAFTAGARCIYTDKPVQTPADLKGYKIRVMESQTCMLCWMQWAEWEHLWPRERFIPRFSRV